MKNAHVLILEDDPVSSAILDGWLKALGAIVTIAASVDEANLALLDEKIELIISDVQLPGNNQLEWVETVLNGEFPPPLILLTGCPRLESAVRAANLPISGYLIKPPDLQSLQILLKRLVTNFRRRQELRALSREAAWLLTGPQGEAVNAGASLQQKLLHLSQCLAAEASKPPRETVVAREETSWRNAISETIEVLEKTKHSFRSKELGQLRQRLQRIVGPNPEQSSFRSTGAAA